MIPLRVTSGEIEVAINHPSVRAVKDDSEGIAETTLHFRYDGPTEEKKPLGSGEIRHQMGVKLYAADGNNVVYCMWRFDPDEPTPAGNVQVQVKWEGEYYPADEIYSMSKQLAPEVGRVYRLRAAVDNEVVRVWIMDEPVWVGALPEDIMRNLKLQRGLIGLRADNVRLGAVRLS